MAKSELAKSQTVVEPLFDFDLLSQDSLPRTSLPSPPSFCSVATSYPSESEALVYAGTRSGALLLLSVDLSSLQSSTSSSSSLLANDKVKLLRFIWVSDCAIDSIHVLAQISKVLVVSDGFIYLTDSLLIQPVKRSTGLVKGVRVVARRVRSSISSVSGNANLTGDELQNNQSTSQRLLKKIGAGIRSNGVKPKELDMNRDDNDFVFAVATGKKIIFIHLVDGLSGSFVVLKEMQCVEGIKTMVWLDDTIIVGTSTEYTLISCKTGETSVMFTLPDASSQPRLKLLSKGQKVLLLVDNAGIVVNGLGQPVSGTLVFRQVPDSIGELSSYVVAAASGKIELYHKKSGACVQALSIGEPGVLAEEDDGGRFVAVATPSKVICYCRVPYEEQIKDLLRKKSFKEAITLVEELVSEGEITKEMVSFVHAQVGFLLLFDLRFKEAVDHFLLSDMMDPSEIFPFVMRDPNRWSLLVARNRYWGLHPPPAHVEDVVEDGLVAIQRAIFLKKAGVETAMHDEFLLSPPSRADLLESAFREIIRYLQGSREKELSPPVQEGVDTLLMYLYRTLNCVNDMEKLASSQNSCIVEELETLLEESGHLRTLAFLYANKGISSKALAIWRALARSNSSGIWNNPETGNSLQVLSGPKTAAIEASKILQHSSDQDLVLQHLGWVSELDEELAVQVLTSEERTHQLSPDDVIAAIDPRKVDILQRYLQWLIEDQDSNDTQFHTLYALSLAKSALDAIEEISMEDVEDSRKLNRWHGKHLYFESRVRDRLQKFLLMSDFYYPEEVLELIERSELWLEKAILYKKLGQETLVLQILALKLEDSEAAEQYCAELGRPDAYMQLLDMYLDPQNGKEPMFKAAVRLLHNHGETLDPLQVLERLSPDMPLQLASETILRMLRARLHHHRQGQIVRNLSCAVDVDVRLARLEERARSVQINGESLCESCHARLGTKLFAIYPDDSVVCYKCFRRQGESTSVAGRNFRRDILFKPGWLVSR